MRIARSDVLALLIVLGAAIASLVVWQYGKVDLGLSLGTSDGRLVVADMTPDGNAMRAGFWPGTPIIDLTTVDGGKVQRGDPIDMQLEGALPDQVSPLEFFLGTQAVELQTYDGTYRLPIEPIPSARIATVSAGDIDPEAHWINVYATLDRGFLEFQLQQSLWVAGIWVLLGAVVWRLLIHGVAGSHGRDHALKIGMMIAAPAIIWPVVQVGTAAGVAAGYLVPAAVALVLGWTLARQHPDPQWVQTGRAASFVAAALAAILVIRYLSAPVLSPGDPDTILVLIGAIAIVPGLIGILGRSGSMRERGQLGSLALVPAAAMTIHGDTGAQIALPLVLLALLFGWQLLPLERAAALVDRGAARIRSDATRASVVEVDREQSATRDLLCYLLLGGSVFISLGAPIVRPIGGPELAFGAWAVAFGVGLAALVGFSVRRGFLGAEWTDAAAPLAAAVGVPVMMANLTSGGHDLSVAAGPTAFAALAVAHVLILRHPDSSWRARLLLASGGLAGFTILVAISGVRLTVPLIALIAMIPGLPIALAGGPGEARAFTARLETLAVALTPGMAAVMLVPSIGFVVLGAWLIAIVVWRRFTLAPLLGLAQRTQLQRDLAVTAAETERARLAADLHDDALQQLTMLVRTLDASGNTEAANEAREVATKLRSVVGDLRLPILDDLGAGAALEWLVERVEPLAGGPVKLERSDETRPPANVELAVFRVAQEALTNAIKHGKAPIAVRYDVRSDGRVTLAVDDAGPGIGADAAEVAPHQGHFGPANMQQRAEQIGALLDVRRWPAGGTRVALEWRPQ